MFVLKLHIFLKVKIDVHCHAEVCRIGRYKPPAVGRVLIELLLNFLGRGGYDMLFICEELRVADDFLVFSKTEQSATRVFRSVERYLTRKLKLVVNHDKSSVCRTEVVEYLGYR